MSIVTLAHPADVAGWRAAARSLLTRGVAPEAVQWQVAGEGSQALFDETPVAMEAASQPAAALRVPAGFVPLADQALLHADPQRFALMYRLLWRLLHEPGLRHDPLDADRQAAHALAQAVRRDQYEMRAFLRFHPRGAAQALEYVAWFEPRHHVVASQAPFFQARFAAMRWAIFTPLGSVAWDGQKLHHGAGAPRDGLPQHPGGDGGDALWRTYYASIFNPARPKPAHMQQQMPRRLWQHLPEAPLIAPLLATAAARAEAMVAQPPTETRRRLPLAAPEASATQPLAQMLSRCRECPHAIHATQAVPGEGPPTAALALVGEQPGDQEDLHGRPFVGPAGQLLDRALAAAGVPRGQLYLTNAVKHFKYELRGKRRMHKTPAQRDVDMCRGWLERELGGLAARRLVALGGTAARALLGRAVPVNEQRGRWLPRPDGREVMVTWHPAALLRMPPAEREAAFEAWVRDLRSAAAAAFG